MMRPYRNLKPFVIILTVLLMALQAPQALAISDDVIKERIEAEAANTPDLNNVQVSVAVGDRVVVLSGSVRLYHQKMHYEQIAWRTMGVAEVDNEIRVEPTVPLSDEEIELKIQEIVKTFARFRSAGIQARVEKGAVFLSGTFALPRDVLFLKHQVGKIEGVIAIEMKISLRT